MEIFIAICVIYLILLSFIYINKKKVKSAEIKIYGIMLIINVIGGLIELAAYYFAKKMGTGSIYTIIITKAYLLYLLCFTFLLSDYIYAISLNKDYSTDLRNKNVLKFGYIYSFIISIIIILSKINFPSLYSTYCTGQGVNILISSISVFIIFALYILIKNLSSINKKKYLPILLYFAGMIFIVALQKSHPEITIQTIMHCITLFIMYNTIENPDIKLVEYEQKEREKIIAAAESKSEFLSSTSHELRTPLNAIIGLSEDIQSFEDMNSEIIDDTRDLINASNALLDIISNILDSSKIESGKLDVVECDYDSRKEYEALGNIYRIKAYKNRLQFNMNISDNVPKVLYGDKQRIKQIISNLLDNAIKFTDVGKVNFNIDWNNQYNILIISVVDTGNGLSDEEIKKFISNTEELKIEKVHSTKGSGLGLSITKNLIKILGGRAKIDSKKMVGTKFVINIPQKLGSEKALEESEATNSINININNLDFSGKRILVVDDNIINIKVLKKAIKTFNFEVDECYNGKDAIDKIELNNNYDLVLMDIMMPVMGGEEAIGLLRQKSNFTTPVIALTADAVSGAKEKYTKMGFNDYMSKPFSRETVAKKISGIFN